MHKQNHPKFAIANGFAIGKFLKEIQRYNSKNIGKVDVEKLPNEIRALFAPNRLYDRIFAYSDGSHKYIQSHYQFFKRDQSMVGGVMNHVREMGVGQNMYIMLCGQMTPDQRTIVRKCVETDLDEYMDLINYFIKELGHPGYSGIPMPEKFTRPLFVEDKESDNNTDRSEN